MTTLLEALEAHPGQEIIANVPERRVVVRPLATGYRLLLDGKASDNAIDFLREATRPLNFIPLHAYLLRLGYDPNARYWLHAIH